MGTHYRAVKSFDLIIHNISRRPVLFFLLFHRLTPSYIHDITSIDKFGVYFELGGCNITCSGRQTNCCIRGWDYLCFAFLSLFGLPIMKYQLLLITNCELLITHFLALKFLSLTLPVLLSLSELLGLLVFLRLLGDSSFTGASLLSVLHSERIEI